ncbi:MAG: DUF3604 domain-containing protein [Gammaproteobacteria bacterium]
MKILPAILVLIFTLFSCSQSEDLQDPQGVVRDLIDVAEAREALRNIPDIPWDSQVNKTHYQAKISAAANRKPLFGDLHVHTRYSFDAYVFGTLASPDNAYEYAKGMAIKHPAGFDVRLKKPLDFYGVTDHGMFLGLVREAATPDTDFYNNAASKSVRDINISDNLNLGSFAQRRQAFAGFLTDATLAAATGSLDRTYIDNISRSAWADTIEAADRHNAPGKFTTFVGYEYTTSTPNMGNLHRNVIFLGSGNKYPALPFSRANSTNPEKLWDWMDGLREQGIDSIAIPHNSNGSDGAMFEMVQWNDKPIDITYAQQRLRNEPLVEITQVKGTSDTHPSLSMNDEWADFEIMPYKVATMDVSKVPGSYVREALRNGLILENKIGANPYKFGVIGSSDTHTAAASLEESNYFSKVGLLDSNAELRGSIPVTSELLNHPEALVQVGDEKYFQAASITWGASGLTGVWAEENTRDSIFSAFRRKETFGTSGPRMLVRFFAGFDLDPSKINAPDLIEYLYNNAYSMGSDIDERNNQKNLSFFVWAVSDTDSAPLQRVQIIKGWIENGETFEAVFDVACSDGLEIDPITHRCPDNNARVNLADCSFSTDKGDDELMSFWEDPDFDPAQRAFYYVRVLENPTCRWSTWDALRAGVEPRKDIHKTIQERAWSSPIHYLP